MLIKIVQLLPDEKTPEDLDMKRCRSYIWVQGLGEKGKCDNDEKSNVFAEDKAFRKKLGAKIKTITLAEACPFSCQMYNCELLKI